MAVIRLATWEAIVWAKINSQGLEIHSTKGHCVPLQRHAAYTDIHYRGQETKVREKGRLDQLTRFMEPGWLILKRRICTPNMQQTFRRKREKYWILLDLIMLMEHRLLTPSDVQKRQHFVYQHQVWPWKLEVPAALIPTAKWAPVRMLPTIPLIFTVLLIFLLH